MKGLKLSLCLMVALLTSRFAFAAIVGPYTPDASTLHLWHFDESATPCVDFAPGGTNLAFMINGATLGNASYSNSPVSFTNCIRFGTTAGSGDVVFPSGSGDVGNAIPFTYAGTNGAFTFEAMVYIGFNPSASGADPCQIMDCDADGTGTRVFQLRLDPVGFAAGGRNTSAVGIEFINGTTTIAVPPIPTTGSNAIAASTWFHVAVTYNGSANTTSNLLFYWTLVNSNATSANCIYGTNMTSDLPGIGTATTIFSLGNSARNPGGGTGPDAANFVGLIDEVRISSVARASNQMLFAVVSTGFPVINANPVPAGQSVTSGQVVNYSVTATGPLLNYQWQENGSPLLNATNSEFTIAAAFPINSGSYDVVVSNSYGAVTSTAVSLTVTGFATNQFIFDSFSDSFWTIINQGNGNALVAGSIGATQQPYTNGATAQQYQLLLNLQNGTFRLRQRSTWDCVSSLGSPAGPGAELSTLLSYTGAGDQQWYIVSAGNGYYRIFNSTSNTVLQTDNGTPAKVTMEAASASPFQLWQINYQTNFPKKGTAGYEGSPYNTELTTQWAYNYDDNTGASEASSFDFVPMVYDAPDWENIGAAQGLDAGWKTSAKASYLLCYNEPDNSTQSDTTTNAAVAMWPALEALNVPIVGPGTQDTLDAWENSFYQLIANNNYRVDYASIHEYVPPNASSLISDCESVYNAYGRPVWLTEFSPVDWNSCECWSENDDYNFLAEFLWQAESLTWFKRYAIFPFSNTNPDSPWVDNGFTGSVFLADGQTLSPYGELYATWDATLTLQAVTPYLIHNLATSFRLTATNGVNTPLASDIYVRNTTTEWALLQSPTVNNWYIISLNDGRRLSCTNGALALAPFGTVGTAVQWTFTGPGSLGYYYIANTNAGLNLYASGTAPAINFSTITSSSQTANTEWRLVKPYQPVSISATVTPGGLSATAGDGSVKIGWIESSSDLYYNVYRSTVSGGPYTQVAGGLANATFTDNAVVDRVTYYYVVTGLNILAQQSSYSAQIVAQPTSLNPPLLGFGVTTNGIQFGWPSTNTGWLLQAQTNSLGTNWVTVSGTGSTNQVLIPINPANGSVFYRLIHP
jgi:hypothetical protein